MSLLLWVLVGVEAMLEGGGSARPHVLRRGSRRTFGVRVWVDPESPGFHSLAFPVQEGAEGLGRTDFGLGPVVFRPFKRNCILFA